MQGSGACWPGPQGLGARQRLKCWSEDGNRLSCLRVLRPGPMTLRRNKKLGLQGSQALRRVAGPRGLWARSPGAWGRAPRAWGPAQQGPGAFFPTKTTPFANLLAGAWRRRGCRLKRLLRRWGPGGKRSRDTPPTPPPPAPPPPPFWGCFHPLRLRQPSNTPPKVGGYGYSHMPNTYTIKP